jgi:hypothetical protein
MLRERIELVNQTLGIHPAAASLTATLVVRNTGFDGAESRAIGGDPDGIGRDGEPSDAQPPQVGHSGVGVGEAAVRMLRPADERSGHRAGAHILERRRIDDIVAIAGAQQLEEVEPGGRRLHGRRWRRVPAAQSWR